MAIHATFAVRSSSIGHVLGTAGTIRHSLLAAAMNSHSNLQGGREIMRNFDNLSMILISICLMKTLLDQTIHFNGSSLRINCLPLFFSLASIFSLSLSISIGNITTD